MNSNTKIKIDNNNYKYDEKIIEKIFDFDKYDKEIFNKDLKKENKLKEIVEDEVYEFVDHMATGLNIEDKEEQYDAIAKIKRGELSYAEMRMIAG